MRKIQIVPLSRREEMRRILNEYLIELSEFDPDIKFDDKGIPIYKWFDYYWVDRDRFPIYFIIDNNVAGIALIRELENRVYEIAEFYVLPEYRGNGNAIWFASELTNLFDGEFVFATRHTNHRAIRFWGKFAEMYEGSEYYDDPIWRNWTIRKIDVATHELNLNPIYYDLIKSGEKTLEGRLNDEKRKVFNIGDKIIFYREPERVETMNAIILDKYLFDNFDDMANKLNKADLGFATKSKEEMVKVYRTIYTTEDENKYGVVIFKIKTI